MMFAFLKKLSERSIQLNGRQLHCVVLLCNLMLKLRLSLLV